MATKKGATKTVEDYIGAAPHEWQGKLKELRKAIKSAVPLAEERISYSIPAYYYNGPVIFFALWKTHIGLYPIQKEWKAEFARYMASKATARIPLDEKLPIGLIKRWAKARFKENKAQK